jgi:hypothetical protein
VAFSLSGSTLGSAVSLVLRKPDGTALTSTSFSAATAFIDAVTLPVAGQYQLVIDPYRAAVGSIEAEVVDTDVEIVLPIEADGPQVTAGNESPGRNFRLETQLVAETFYRLRIDAASGRTNVTVRDGSGTVITTNTSSSLDKVVPFTAPADGVYTISVDPVGSAAGSWRFELFTRVGTPRIGLPASSTGWYPSATMAISWPVTGGEAVAGYAIAVDQAPGTEPTALTHTGSSGRISLQQGVSWLHARAVLPDGTLGGVAHARVQVDTGVPVLGPLESLSHPDSTVLYGDGHVSVRWSEPEDLSGIAGYSLDATQDPSGVPDAIIDTTATSHEIEVDRSGLWYVRVRPVDLAGNVGPAEVLEINVDVAAPAAPTFTSTHQDGVPSAARLFRADLTPGDEDAVAGWAVVVDQLAGTVPDPAERRTDPSVLAVLSPGTWWLHARAGDALGRWSDTTHVQVIVSETAVDITMLPGSKVWTSTAVPVACADGAEGLRLAVAPAAGAPQAVAPLGGSQLECSGSWDPTVTAAGQRSWPDGEYELTIIDETGAEVAARVAVTVAVASTPVERAIADYRVGLITAEQLVDYLVRMLMAPSTVPARYLDGAAQGGLSPDVILDALRLIDPALRDEVIERLTPDDAPAGVEGRATNRAASQPECTHFPPDDPVCKLRVAHFVITYTPAAVGVSDSYPGTPPVVAEARDALLFARSYFDGLGFKVPETTYVTLMDEVNLAPGYGISLATNYIGMNLSGGPSDDYITYLAVHEYFHQVQYQYFNFWDHGSDLYWWMEATAEWAAHLAQSGSGYPAKATDSYAHALKPFLASSDSLHIGSGQFLVPGGNEYGAFVLAEFLEERFEGDEAIRWIWDRMGDGLLGVRPLDAISDYVGSRGSTYAAEIERFRVWNYVLSDSGGIGYSDAHAGTFWRDTFGSNRQYRRVSDSAEISTMAGVASGTVNAAASNAAYIEVDKPAGVGGTFEVVVRRAPGRDDSLGARATVVPIGRYPATCGTSKALTRTTSGELAMLTGSITVSPECSKVAIVITNPARTGARQSYDWEATFEGTSTVLSNNVIDVGVNRSGSLVANGVGIRRAGNASTDVLTWGCPCASWGIADGTSSGWTDTNASAAPQGKLSLETFDADGRDARVTATLGASLDVEMQYRPSADTDLYAIDVQVKRRASSATSGRVLFETALDFDVPPGWDDRVTWGSTSGEVPEFVDYFGRDGFHNGNPLTNPSDVGEPMVLGASSWSGDHGTVVRLDLGDIPVGDRVLFTMYVGVSRDMVGAESAISTVEPSMYAHAVAGGGASTDSTVGTFAFSPLRSIPISGPSGPDPM